LAVFFKAGDEKSEFIETIRADEENPVAEEIPLMELIRNLNQDFLFHYKGSLTTPPCSEVVNWLVVLDP
jgi:carbonic anhydrase